MAVPWGEIISAGANIIASNQGGGKSWIPEAAWPHQLQAMTDPLGAVTRSAKLHGIHPVYAIGGGTPNVPSFTAMGGGKDRSEGISRMGQDLARAATPHMTADQRAMHEANLRAARAGAAKDEAIAAFYSAEAAKVAAPGASPAFDAYWPGVNAAGVPTPGVGPVSRQPAAQLAADPRAPQRTPATQPLLEKVRGPDGTFELFSPIQMEERIGEAGMALMLPYLLGHNLRGVIADQFEKLWPTRDWRGSRILTKKDRQDADYERWKKHGVRPRGWDFNKMFGR